MKDFDAAVDLGQQLETLTPIGTTLPQARTLARSGQWKSRLCPNLADSSCWTPAERLLWDHTTADFPLAGLLMNRPGGDVELFSGHFLPVTLYVTVPRAWYMQQVTLLARGQPMTFCVQNFALGNGHPVNFVFSPRSATLWFRFMISIGLQQGTLPEDQAKALMLAPITLGIRCMRSTFHSTTHSWNRFYTDFFTYFDPELQFTLQNSSTLQLRSILTLDRQVDFAVLVNFMNQIRAQTYRGYSMLMHLPVTEVHFNLAQQSDFGSEPPWMTLIRVPRARL